jgi:LysR family glycine cleavage system transcriptional activator
VAAFNDAGLMLQAAEQDLGIALARELLAADALRDGRLVRLSPLAMPDQQRDAYWLVHPPALADWPPLRALHAWLRDELAASQRQLTAASAR